MDVVYEGPLQLGEQQVQQLLGYQAALNKHVNWDKTRTQVRTGLVVPGCCSWWMPAQHCATLCYIV
jgi:hypothetical protein